MATFYVQDGEAFHQVTDALLAQGSIKPVRLVFLEPHNRVADYWLNRSYERLLLEELLPEIEASSGSTTYKGLWGASLGGMVQHGSPGATQGCFPLSQVNRAVLLLNHKEATPIMTQSG